MREALRDAAQFALAILLSMFLLACDDDEVAPVEQPLATAEGHPVIGAKESRNSQAKAEEGPKLPSTERWIFEPTSEDPHKGAFALPQAVEGMPLDGKLIAEIRTDLGFFFCDLFADRKPKTVAHFIGLSRGRRAWWDASAGAWRKEPLYNDASVFRVIPDEMIVAGGVEHGLADIGFKLPFEETETPLIHDRKGQLMLVNGGGKFAISDGPNRALDGQKTHSIFGQCYPEELVFRIARVPQWGAKHDYRPRSRVGVHRVIIRRSEVGASAARPLLPEGRRALPEQRGASRGPSEIAGKARRRREARHK